MCGGPASLRCARCRGVWYCGRKCERGVGRTQVCLRARLGRRRIPSLVALLESMSVSVHAVAVGAEAVAASAAAAAAAARGGGEAVCVAGSGSGGDVTDSSPRESDAGGGRGTGGLSAATLREMA